MNPSSDCHVGFARTVITPPPGVSLAGYFAPRHNRGVLDDLYARVCLFRRNAEIGGIVQLDLLKTWSWMTRAIRGRLDQHGHGDLARNLLVCATHSHTAPDTGPARDERHQHALDFIVDQAVAAVETALERFVSTKIKAGTIINNPFAFNRRYWMKDGRVVTNPGKLNPDIVRPEGGVDRTIHFVRFQQFGRIAAVLVNIVNHTDTIGGDLVSADWPGFLERRIQTVLGYQCPVITLVGASGNINHFDVTSNQEQTSYVEARRIGEGYGEIILRSFDDIEPIAADFRAGAADLTLRKRDISPEDIQQARRTLAEADDSGDALTSEDLARGAPAVLRYFAEQLLRFAEAEAGRTEVYPVTVLRLGKDLAVMSLPGEPFTEIGMAIREQSPFARTMIASNANGAAGYIPLDDCFEHGGYEPLPVCGGGMGKGSARACIDAAVTALRSVAP